MNDTTPEVQGIYRKMLMQRSNQERFIMGTRMFDAAREIVLASLPEGLLETERRVQLFLRFYGNDFDAETKQRIVDWFRK